MTEGKIRILSRRRKDAEADKRSSASIEPEPLSLFLQINLQEELDVSELQDVLMRSLDLLHHYISQFLSRKGFKNSILTLKSCFPEARGHHHLRQRVNIDSQVAALDYFGFYIFFWRLLCDRGVQINDNLFVVSLQ